LILSKYKNQKVFLARGFRITPGILTYDHGDWWYVKAAYHLAYFLKRDVKSVRVVADIPHIIVSDSNHLRRSPWKTQ